MRMREFSDELYELVKLYFSEEELENETISEENRDFFRWLADNF